MSSSTSAVSYLAFLPWGCCLPFMLPGLHATYLTKQTRALQQTKPNHYNRKSNVPSWCILYNNIFRKRKIFRLESQQPYFFFFWDEKYNKNGGNWPLSAKHDGAGLFHIYERSALHRLLILTWMRRKRDIFKLGNSGPWFQYPEQ